MVQWRYSNKKPSAMLQASEGCNAGRSITVNTSDYTSKDIDRFWKKVDQPDNPDDCWLWNAGKTIGGYGKLGVGNRKNNKTILAHRLSYCIAFGETPDNMLVLHSCDVPSCVNPKHLFLGTDKDNAADKMSKGRWRGGCPPGENSAMAKLTWDQVFEIREKYKTGEFTMQTLANEYGVWKGTIGKIINYDTWPYSNEEDDNV